MLTPRDIHEAEFKRVWRGYDPEEVDAFLQRVVSAYESVYKENERLRQRIQELEKRLEEYSRSETQIDELIALAKKTEADVKEAAEYVKAAAEKQASSIVSEARVKAQKILAEAQDRVRHDLARLERWREEAAQFKSAVARASEEFLTTLDRLIASIERYDSAAPMEVAAAFDADGEPEGQL